MMTNQERRSILCPNCRKLISVDESPCPYCGLKNPGSRWRNNFWTRGFFQGDQLIKGIIYLNGAMFLLSLIVNPAATGFSMNPFGLLSPGSESLLLLGATGSYPINAFHRWWTLLTAMYLHGGILHIFFNMMAFYQIAPFILQEYGGYRLVSIYTLSGVGGYLASYLAGVPLTLGASGALCGLIGATLYYGKNRGGVFGQMIMRRVGAWAIGLFIFGLVVPGIDNWAHGGGMICGALTGALLGYQERVPENYLHKVVAAVCIVATLAAIIWAIGSTVVILFFDQA